MVDVEGLRLFKGRLTEKCNSCVEEQIANTEWSNRESLSHILKTENDQYSNLFKLYPYLKFLPTSSGSLFDVILKRETLGVTTMFMGFNLFECPILLGGKMFSLIMTGCKYVDVDLWSKYHWTYPKCLFCCFNSDSYIPTTFVVRGKLYTLGFLAWTNYERVIYMKKREGFVMFRKSPQPPITDTEFPVLNDFSGIQQSIKTAIGNRKLFCSGFVFPEMIRQTLIDIARFYKNPKKNVLIKQLIKNQNQKINTGAIDSIIGKHTDFNSQENDQTHLSKVYNPNNVGRYKIIYKIDYTTISKCLQIDTLTTKYSKKIPTDLNKADIGFVCLVSSSEQNAGTLGLEAVLGCVISSLNDIIPESEILSIIKTMQNPSAKISLLNEPSDFIPCDSCWYLIINQCIYKQVKQVGYISLYSWVNQLQQYFKLIAPYVEVYCISDRLYCIYSLPLTLYKILHDGLPYSSMEVFTTEELYIDLIKNNYNLHGPTALLIQNLNCNHLVRNIIAIHALKTCITAFSSKLLKNETYLLNKFQLVSGVPFHCIKANILLLPLPHNVEDSCVLTESAAKKRLFAIRHKLTSTVHLENPTLVKILINKFPTLIKANMVLLKFQAESVIHVGKHLTLVPDVFHNDIQNVMFTPNTDVVIQEEVQLLNIKIIHDSKKNNCYCDFVITHDQEAVLGTKIIILNGVQKCVFGHILPKNETPLLHNSLVLEDVANVDIDLIQHPYSLKRLGMNFLYKSKNSFYNDCFSISSFDRLKELEGKKDFYISDPKTGKFYVEKNGEPIKTLLYEGYVLVMGKQNPYNLMHAPDINSTSISCLTGQPEIKYQTTHYVNKNNHSYALSDTERELTVSIGCLNVMEELQDMSDQCSMVLENVSGDKVCIQSSSSLLRVLDFLAIAGINIDFSVKDVETDF